MNIQQYPAKSYIIVSLLVGWGGKFATVRMLVFFKNILK
jgi:hypothetical protein